MALITVDDVQAWFTTNRLSLELTDDLPEESNVSTAVVAKASTRYDISAWLTPATTPDLIRSVISSRVAAIRYRKHYADQVEDELGYADWLDNWSTTTLDGIVAGTIPLLDVSTGDLATAQDAASISFFPTDASSVDDGAKFTMVTEF